MKKKVALNVYVTSHLRSLIKIKAAKEGVTMAAIMEQIIVEWAKAHNLQI